jgi:polyferredoxin
MLCVPGLNCYSCPGAVASCPLGSLQSALVSAKYKRPYYVLGLLILFGVLLGRVVCGFLCPFGFLQEILYRIPTKKLKKNRWTRRLSRIKYFILVVFAAAVPLAFNVPGFCKYICPAGTLEGGIPLAILNTQIREMTGTLFTWKVGILIMTVLAAVFVFRLFCRFLCPLGAFYSLFNRVAFAGIVVEADKCTGCQKCVKNCKMDIKCVGDGECIQCGCCIEECTAGAIQRTIRGRRQNIGNQSVR